MSPRLTKAELMQQARFVFIGTVVRPKAVTMKSIPADDKTAVVRVDQVIQAPPALQDYVGQEITVLLKGGGKLANGDRATFYTNGWQYGESLAVREVTRTAVGQAGQAGQAVAALGPGAPQPATPRTRALQAQINSASVVVTGRVTSVHLPPAPPAVAALGPGGVQGAPTRISEHDPMWRDAVVEVSGVEKGNAGQNNVVVRFPSSTDVRWYRAPKFTTGQEGVFILHRDQLPQVSAVPPVVALGPGGQPPPVYTALTPLDFHPVEELANIRSHIQGNP